MKIANVQLLFIFLLMILHNSKTTNYQHFFQTKINQLHRKSVAHNFSKPELQLHSAPMQLASRNQFPIIRNNVDLASLSTNISAILENLLKNYNNQVRPGYNEGRTTTIRLNMLIRSMGPITEKEMKYSMDCYLRQEWHDDRLRFQGPLQQLTLNIKMLEALWKPDTYFHNGHGSYVHTITRPNKLFRIDQSGKILYSMRLTIKAKCPMELRNFPMDKQSCPLLIGSYAYTTKDVVYEWDTSNVSFEPGMTLSQYDLLSKEFQNYSTRWRKGGVYSMLQVNFILQRHAGYFLIQVYVPCILIVILSWVSFWINREATSDRVGLGITTVLTLSTISLDTRTDLPKVHYATALDWFILMSFGYCIATLLQFAAVHFFTKLGSGEIAIDEEEWLDLETIEVYGNQSAINNDATDNLNQSSHCYRSASFERVLPENDFQNDIKIAKSTRRFCISHELKLDDDEESDLNRQEYLNHRCPEELTMVIDEASTSPILSRLSVRTIETQTEQHDSFWSQLFKCITGNDRYRRERTRQAMKERSVNSVSIIDRIARVLFPASYGVINMWYWYSYYHTKIENTWNDPGFDHNYL